MKRPLVLVFAGLDPSGGAGVTADVEAIAANGAHALPIVTALTVQDQNRVHEVCAVNAALIVRQADALAAAFDIGAVKLGIPGSVANAGAIAAFIARLRQRHPQLPVVLDPVLASGHGDRLAGDRADAGSALAPLLALATIVTPNLGEAAAIDTTACPHVLVTGGHAAGPEVVNRWTCGERQREWRWPRLAGQFHGSGCTLAAAIAARLARGEEMGAALDAAQAYVHATLANAFSVGPGQSIPHRSLHAPQPVN